MPANVGPFGVTTDFFPFLRRNALFVRFGLPATPAALPTGVSVRQGW